MAADNCQDNCPRLSRVIGCQRAGRDNILLPLTLPGTQIFEGNVVRVEEKLGISVEYY